jgi:hypothetical protein
MGSCGSSVLITWVATARSTLTSFGDERNNRMSMPIYPNRVMIRKIEGLLGYQDLIWSGSIMSNLRSSIMSNLRKGDRHDPARIQRTIKKYVARIFTVRSLRLRAAREHAPCHCHYSLLRSLTSCMVGSINSTGLVVARPRRSSRIFTVCGALRNSCRNPPSPRPKGVPRRSRRHRSE